MYVSHQKIKPKTLAVYDSQRVLKLLVVAMESERHDEHNLAKKKLLKCYVMNEKKNASNSLL